MRNAWGLWCKAGGFRSSKGQVCHAASRLKKESQRAPACVQLGPGGSTSLPDFFQGDKR